MKSGRNSLIGISWNLQVAGIPLRGQVELSDKRVISLRGHTSIPIIYTPVQTYVASRPGTMNEKNKVICSAIIALPSIRNPCGVSVLVVLSWIRGSDDASVPSTLS
eukprot:1147357-Pelagomonas_calceolata.AAC.6